jgi:excisionase family DNA binding protein
MSEMPRLVSVPIAAERADVARNTMLLAAKNGKIRAVRLGRDWLIYEDDIERWKQENYQPTMSRKKPSGTNQNTDAD